MMGSGDVLRCYKHVIKHVMGPQALFSCCFCGHTIVGSTLLSLFKSQDKVDSDLCQDHSLLIVSAKSCPYILLDVGKILAFCSMACFSSSVLTSSKNILLPAGDP